MFKLNSFKLIKSNLIHIDFQLNTQLKNQQITIDEFAKIHTNFIRCISESTIKTVLEMNKFRSKDTINNLLKQFWNIYYQQAKENLDQLQIATNQAYLVLKKL